MTDEQAIDPDTQRIQQLMMDALDPLREGDHAYRLPGAAIACASVAKTLAAEAVDRATTDARKVFAASSQVWAEMRDERDEARAELEALREAARTLLRTIEMDREWLESIDRTEHGDGSLATLRGLEHLTSALAAVLAQREGA